MDDDLVDFFFNQTIRVDMSNKGKDLSYGMLIKHKSDLDYIKGFVEGNQIAWTIKYSQEWMEMKKEGEEIGLGRFYTVGTAYLFSASGSYFKYSMIGIAVLIAAAILFGIVYELKRQSYICANYGVATAKPP